MKLETKRLILREWKKSDINNLIEGLNNLNVSKWLVTVAHPYTKKDATSWINHCIRNSKKRKNRTTYELAIELKSEKKVIGGVSLSNINFFHNKAGGGIWVNEKYHGFGYGVEAFGESIRFGFINLNLRKMENGYLQGNKSSLKMQKKLGYKLEGVRRNGLKCKADGKFKDEFMTGLLKSDWERKLKYKKY